MRRGRPGRLRTGPSAPVHRPGWAVRGARRVHRPGRARLRLAGPGAGHHSARGLRRRPGRPDPAPPGPRLSNTGHGVGSVFVPNRELVVLGTASQTPTRTRNHNGYLLRWDAEGLLFDPGEGTQRQMLFAGVTASQITRICVTHF